MHDDCSKRSRQFSDAEGCVMEHPVVIKFMAVQYVNFFRFAFWIMHHAEGRSHKPVYFFLRGYILHSVNVILLQRSRCS